MSREMKHSGIEWIGEIPKEWKVNKIGNLYHVRNEKVSDKDYPPLSVTMNGIVPQLETAAKTNNGDDRKLVRKGDFAINSRSDRRGSCGVSQYDGSVSLINTILMPRTSMNSQYYNWLFHTELFADEFYKWGHGIVDDLWTTRWQEMKNISIVYPSLAEQQKIANYLDKVCGEVDEMIALQEQMIEELKAYKQSVITEAVTKGLNPDVPMRDSGIDWIGEVPKGWRISKIKMIAQTNSGSTPRNISNSDNSDIIWIRTTDINDDVVYDSSIHLTQEEFSSASCPMLDRGTCVVAMYGGGGTIGKSGFLNVRATINQALCSMEVNDSYHDKYLFCVLKAVRYYWMKYAVGTRKDPNISQEIVRNMLVPMPPFEEQQSIASYLDTKCAEIDALIAIKQAKIEELKEYKKSIIYEYVTGKKEVV